MSSWKLKTYSTCPTTNVGYTDAHEGKKHRAATIVLGTGWKQIPFYALLDKEDNTDEHT